MKYNIGDKVNLNDNVTSNKECKCDICHVIFKESENELHEDIHFNNYKSLCFDCWKLEFSKNIN